MHSNNNKNTKNKSKNNNKKNKNNTNNGSDLFSAFDKIFNSQLSICDKMDYAFSNSSSATATNNDTLQQFNRKDKYN